MAERKLKQLQYESDSWKRLIGFLVDENVRLKNRLSEILRDKFYDNLLEQVENYQSRFIKIDELIGLLRHDMQDFDNLLQHEKFEEGKTLQQVSNQLKRLRNNIMMVEKNSSQLKSDFNTYLSENI